MIIKLSNSPIQCFFCDAVLADVGKWEPFVRVSHEQLRARSPGALDHVALCLECIASIDALPHAAMLSD